MKKILLTFPLLLAGAFTIAINTKSINTHANVVSAVDEEALETAIDIEKLFPTRPEGSHIREAGATYWGGTYSALGKFIDTVDVKSHDSLFSTYKWVQKTQYFYFQMGAANNSKDVALKFHYFDLDENVIKNGDDAVVDVHYNDTFCGNSMLLRHHVVNDYVWTNYGSTGFKVQIELYDKDGYVSESNYSDGYAYHLFGYLHANQTLESCGAAMRDYYRSIVLTNGNYEYLNRPAEIKQHYSGNAHLRSAFVAGLEEDASMFNHSFDSVNDFHANWHFDAGYFNVNAAPAEPVNMRDISYDFLNRVIGTDTYRPTNTNMPFNNDGGFFRGWFENDTLGGFIATDEWVYRFRSAPIKLHENHFVSLKMAGTASLHVIDTSNNTEIAFIDSRVHNYDGFNDENQLIYKGFNTCTMIRHVINLSAFAGKTVQFAIADVASSGWGAVYFDDFIADFDPKAEGVNVDFITQNNQYHTTHRDVYISCLNHNGSNANYGIDYTDDATYSLENTVDASAYKTAHEFVTKWHTTFRGFNTTLCAFANDATLKSQLTAVLGEYNALSDEAKVIVNASIDYHYEGATNDNWFTIAPLQLNLGAQVSYIANYLDYSLTGPLSSRLTIMNNSNSVTFISVASIIIVLVIATSLYFSIKKRKEQKQ